MYCREKPFRHENYVPRKTHRNNPSFSSTLLDEIYRSIDGNGGSPESFDAYRKTPISGFRSMSYAKQRDDETARFSGACLGEKSMKKEANERSAARKSGNRNFQDNDLFFFSSTWGSSDSSGALSSSSDTEFFSSTTKSKASSPVKGPKPVRTGVWPSENDEVEECFQFDDDQDHEKNRVDNDLIKSKSRALKIYANLKKLKQPISPGARLTSFISSFFANMNRKKPKNVDRNKGWKSPDQAASSSSTCSSASSFSRSCLSKYPRQSSEKTRNGILRTARFDLVDVIVDQDSRPSGEKSICDEGYDNKYRKPPLPPNALAELKQSKNRQNQNQRKSDFSMLSKIRNEENDNDDEDAFSESSSGLFELDHLLLFGNNNRHCEELPVYETTYFDKNGGLIR